MNENVLGSIFITVSFSGDSDGDGIPDDVELALGLDPNNPVDAQDDADQDGLITLDEIAFGTDIFVADTDDDGVSDGAEVAAGTNPLDPDSVNYAGFLESIEVIPPIVTLRANAILPAEVTRQLQVLGTLEDGRVVDATAAARGTTYTSSNLLLVNFGVTDGLLFAGQPGSAMVTVSNGDVSVDVQVEVTVFQPVALGFVQIPGQANAVDTVGSHAYIAAGAAGFRIVDVSNPTAPTIVGAMDTPGNGNDVRVSGPCAYLADGSAGLKVIDITDPTNPFLIGSVDTPGNASGVVACGQLVYVADGSAGLQVIDVTDPTLPFIVGSVDTPGLANGVAVDELRQLAMVADDTLGLKVIDISISAVPSIIGSVDTVDAFDVTLDGVFAYVADGNASSNPGGLVAIDTTVPTAPVITSSTPPPGFYTDVVTFGGVALCADVISVNSVHTFILSNPPTPAPSLLINFAGAPSFRDDNGTGIDAEAGFVYMTGTQGFTHLGSSRNGGLHIGQFFELSDDFGIPPTVDIVSPQEGDSFFEGSTIIVEAVASDDIQVAGVQFFVDGEFFATDTAAPFVVFVVAPGGAPSVNLSARAFDLGNNLSDVAAVDVVVIPDPPPTVTITSPTPGDTVIEGATISLAADATDNVAVVRVDFSTDTGFIESDFDAPFAVSFTVPIGVTEVTVNATAFDNISKEGVADPVTVAVIPDPLTTVIGSVVDPDSLPVEGATLTTNGGVTGTTLADGSFSIPDVPTILGDIVVSATATVGTFALFGGSQAFPPVLAGITEVGQIQLIPGFPNGNGGFETGDFTGYAVSGETAVIANLGPLTPPEGQFMAFLSTGGAAVGNTTSTITTDPFTIPAGVDFLTFDFNFLSNEFPDFVGSPFNDTLLVRLTTPDETSLQILGTVNSSPFVFAPAGTGFNGMTGFATVQFDVSAHAGLAIPCTLTFEIQVFDQGDTAVDSAGLIDNLRFEQAIPTVCGNGTIEAGETCDDGNTIPGDGCDENCQVEPGGD